MSLMGYVEVGPRLYEIVIIEGEIRRLGRIFKCYVDHSLQQIQVADLVSVDERPLLVARAVSAAYCRLRPGWAMVPVVGVVK